MHLISALEEIHKDEAKALQISWKFLADLPNLPKISDDKTDDRVQAACVEVPLHVLVFWGTVIFDFRKE